MAGALGSVRTLITIEDHSAGAQLIRLRSWPRINRLPVALTVGLTLLSGLAAIDQAWLAAAVLGGAAAGLGGRCLMDCAAAAGLWLEHAESLGGMRC